MIGDCTRAGVTIDLSGRRVAKRCFSAKSSVARTAALSKRANLCSALAGGTDKLPGIVKWFINRVKSDDGSDEGLVED